MPPRARVFLVAPAAYEDAAAASLRDAHHTVVSASTMVEALHRLNQRTEEPDVTVIGDMFPWWAAKKPSPDAPIVFERLVVKKFPDTVIVAFRTGNPDEHGKRTNVFPESPFQPNTPEYTRNNLGDFVIRLPRQARK